MMIGEIRHFVRLKNQTPFSKISSLGCWCTVIRNHWPQGPSLFQRVRWKCTCAHQCSVMCTRGLQQKKRQEFDSNLFQVS